MTNEQLIRKALAVVAGRRQKALTLADAALAGAHKALPGLEKLEQQQRQAGLAAARAGLAGAEQKKQAALAQCAALEAQRSEMLRAAHLDVAPHFTCPVCRDTGHQGDALCTCVQQLVREMRAAEMNASFPLSLSTFEAFRLDKYPTDIEPSLGISMREQMENVLNYCRQYAQHFSLANPSLYLYGGAGLGKTHLALAIAREVLQKGYDVVYVSAQSAFDAMEKERYAGGDTLSALENAQLLVLDDLGTECLSPYTASCLYSLVNTRVCRRLPTIYTTNIVRDEDLQRRYTEKLVSRLLGSCEMLAFCGEDIRLQGK